MAVPDLLTRVRGNLADWIRGRPDLLVDGHDVLRQRWCELTAIHVEQDEFIADVRRRRDCSATTAEQLRGILQREAKVCWEISQHYALRGDELASYACRGWATYLRSVNPRRYLADFLAGKTSHYTPPGGRHG